MTTQNKLTSSPAGRLHAAIRISKLMSLLAVVLPGCKDLGSPVQPEDQVPYPATVLITAPLPPYQISIGSGLQFVAEVRDQTGAPFSGATVLWTSSDMAVAPIDSVGRLRALSTGTAEIRASVATAMSDPATVEVVQTAGDAATISITAPLSPRVLLGSSVQFVAEVRDALGTLLPDAPVTWSSSVPSVASPDSLGEAAGLTVGTTEIQASSGTAVSDPETLTVYDLQSITIIEPATPRVSVGYTIQFVAEARDDQNTIINVPLEWLSDDPSIASIDSSGIARGIVVGSVAIRARSGSVESQAVTLAVLDQAPDFDTQIQPIFTGSCALSGCHAGVNPKENLSLESGKAYDEIVNVPSNRLASWLRVKPGEPAASLLYLKVSQDSPPSGSRMPLGGPVLSAAEIQQLNDWIAAGAPR